MIQMASEGMRAVRLEKVTLNIGAGEGGDKLEHAKMLLERLTQRTAIITIAKNRNPTWKLKKGDPIGVKVTLRGQPAAEFLKKALTAAEGKVKTTSFDSGGNVAFGVREYIDFPGAKYDPVIGMMGFDVCVTLSKAGRRVSLRRMRRARVPGKQRVTAAEAREFMHSSFGANVVEEEEVY